MKSVERYFHIRPRNGLNGVGPISTRGGATVKVVGDDKAVTVQTAMCSAGDAFCRRKGRDTASAHPMVVLRTDQLPEFLTETSRSVVRRVLKLSHSKRTEHHLWNQDYGFSTKYFNEKSLA